MPFLIRMDAGDYIQLPYHYSQPTKHKLIVQAMLSYATKYDVIASANPAGLS